MLPDSGPSGEWIVCLWGIVRRYAVEPVAFSAHIGSGSAGLPVTGRSLPPMATHERKSGTHNGPEPVGCVGCNCSSFIIEAFCLSP